MRWAKVEGFGGDFLNDLLLGGAAGEPGVEEGFGGGGGFDDLMAFGEFEAVGIFEGGDGAIAGSKTGEEFGVLKEFGRGGGFPLDELHEEKGAASGISNGPRDWRVPELCDTFEGAKSGDGAVVSLCDGLGGGDADTGSVVAARTGADDDA